MALSLPSPFSLRPPARLPRHGSARAGRLALCGAVAAIGLSVAPVRVAVVSGKSMEPALHSGQPILYAPATQDLGVEFERGDLVLARVKGEVCLKRVFAKGGDAIWSFGLPGQAMAARRLIDPKLPVAWLKLRFPRMTYFRTVVPEGTVWLLGDAACSIDSRHWGPVPADQVVGKVIGGWENPAQAASSVQTWDRLPHRRTGVHEIASAR